jgi:hypothetical protein
MLKFHLARNKVAENLHITERALLPTLLNRLAAVRVKVQEERLEKTLVKQVTCVVSVSVGVAGGLDLFSRRSRTLLIGTCGYLRARVRARHGVLVGGKEMKGLVTRPSVTVICRSNRRAPGSLTASLAGAMILWMGH